MKLKLLFTFILLCIFVFPQEKPTLKQRLANFKLEEGFQLQEIQASKIDKGASELIEIKEALQNREVFQNLDYNNPTERSPKTKAHRSSYDHKQTLNKESVSPDRQKKLSNIGTSEQRSKDSNSSLQKTKQADVSSSSPFESMKGKREVPSKRDMYSKTYDNGDGSFTALVGAGPIHYEKNGQFLDIDPGITVNFDQTYPYVNADNLFQSYFGATSSTGVKDKTDDGELREFLNTKMYWEVNGQPYGMVTAAEVPVQIDDNRAYYRNLYGSIDAEFTVLDGRRELNYIIPNQQALGITPANAEFLVFSEDVVLPLGWTHQVTKEGILIKNALGQGIYLYTNPISKDAVFGTEIEQNTVFETRLIGNTLTVLTKVKTNWLLSNERVYPIKVDPTTDYFPDNANYWTGYVRSNGTGGDNDMRVGNQNNGGSNRQMRGFSKYNLTALPNGSIINSVDSWQWFSSMNGSYTNRVFTLADITVDPVPSSWSAIYNSVTQGVTDWAWALTANTAGWMLMDMNNNGITHVQNSIAQNWVAICLYPQSGYSNGNNYHNFTGYSHNTRRPVLEITYTTPSCAAPSNLDVDNITHNSARFTWTAASPAPSQGYDYYYNTTGIAPTGGPSGSVGAGITQRTQTGLTPDRVYHFWIRSRCAGSDRSMWMYGGWFNTLPDQDCIHDEDQGQAKGEVYDGLNIGTGIQMVADDFIVDPGTKMTVKQITFEVLAFSNPSTLNFTLKILDDALNQEYTITKRPNYTSPIYTNAFGVDLYHVSFTIPDWELSAGQHWFQPSVGTGMFWRSTNNGPYGIERAISSDDGGMTWYYEDEMVFFVAGDCEIDDSVCEPISYTDPQFFYINDTSFSGGLNPNDIENLNNGYANGYQDWTSLSPKPRQAQGQVLNMHLRANQWRGVYKAWVDWNKDGQFDPSEQVYNTGTGLSNIGLFGFVIPPGQTPGEYRLRVRLQNSFLFDLLDDDNVWETGDLFDFTACEDFESFVDLWTVNGNFVLGEYIEFGEVEDYEFEVIADCPDSRIADINTDSDHGHNCGPGTVTLSAEAVVTAGTTYNWYTEKHGGTLLATNSGEYTTVPLTTPGTYTYWVTAMVSGCETVERYPVTAVIDPIPTIGLEIDEGEICGDESNIKLTSSGDSEEVSLVDEKFDSALGVFKNISIPNSTPTASWTNRPNPYQANYLAYKPALSSGYFNGNFVASITNVAHNAGLTKILELTNSVSAVGVTDLKLDFDLYFQTYFPGGDANDEYFSVEVYDGSTWNPVAQYLYTVGNPGGFVKQTIDLSAYDEEPNLKVRFINYSGGDSTGHIPTIAALDNVRLYGMKELLPDFEWTGVDINILDGNCSSTMTPGQKADGVCIKPTEAQLENNTQWEITATGTLSNGCSVSSSIIITNMTKIWNPTTASTNWGATNRWKPAVPVPTADNCVIVKKTVNINGTTHGLGKNLKVKDDGQIFIKGEGSLTITDFVKNENSASDFIVEDGGNLIQINGAAANEGEIITWHFVQDMNNIFVDDMDYVYWSSPVANQNLHAFSPGTPTGHEYWAFLEYDESTDYFENTLNTNFDLAKGYAIGAETSGAGIYDGYDKTYEFKGEPNNGPINFTLSHQGAGYNLVGNPYPSNIDADVLFDMNSSTINSIVYLWTNNDPVPYQEGTDYNGNNYAVYNPVGGTPATQAAGSGSGWQMSAIPDGTIRSGQGFLVEAKGTTGSLLKFDNFNSADDQMLRVHAKAPLFQKGERDRYWITLTSPSQILNTALIGYVPGATDGFDGDYDAQFFGASDAVYTLLNGQELQIQGRQYPLDIRDVVQLGINNYEDGVYLISLDNPEGIFRDVTVYLIDKELGIVHNLSNEPYKYFTRKGKTYDRFEIRYRKVGFGTSAENNFTTVTRQKEDIIILSTLENIKEVQLFDILGMEVYQNVKVNGKKLRIPAARWMNSILFAKIITEDGQVTTTKVLLK